MAIQENKEYRALVEEVVSQVLLVFQALEFLVFLDLVFQAFLVLAD